MADNYLTIKEFAAAAGVSQQAVYKRLEKALKPYYKIIDGKKMIAKEGLELYNFSTIQPTIKSTVVEPVENTEAVRPSGGFSSLNHSTNPTTGLTTTEAQFEALNKTLEILQRELEVKNKQIDDLNNRLAEALKTVDNQTLLLNQQQQLSLMDKIEGKAETTTADTDYTIAGQGDLERRSVEIPTEEQPKQESKGFFKRLFGL